MKISRFVSALLILPPLFLLSGSVLFGQTPIALQQAVEQLESGDLPAAESGLRQYLASSPADSAALGLLAVVLDEEKRYAEAEAIYRRALAAAPPSPALFNNYGNHLLHTGNSRGAQSAFLKAVALDKHHANANLQLARLALDEKQGPAALAYLASLPAPARSLFETDLLRLEALLFARRDAEASELLGKLQISAANNPALNFSLGLSLARGGRYGDAETAFSETLAARPGDFDTLYNLGLAAAHAGDNDRARSVLESALEERPADPDVLFHLGLLEHTEAHDQTALVHLAQAAARDPRRADIQKLLAQVTFALGYYADSADCWSRYLVLAPDDLAGLRERGFTTALAGKRDGGSADLRAVLARRPQDALAHWELGLALSVSDRPAADAQLTRALAIQPRFPAALYARGVLRMQMDRLEPALADLSAAARLEPGAAVFDQLGKTNLKLKRNSDAVAVLQRAADLQPDNRKVLLHLGEALKRCSRAEEAAAVFSRYRALGPDPSSAMPGAGIVGLLQLSPERQYELYRQRVEQAVAADPGDLSAQVRLLKLLLADQAWERVDSLAAQLLAKGLAGPLLVDAGRALVDAGRYRTAVPLLANCSSENSGARFLHAVALFHVEGSTSALAEMDAVPDYARDGDYYLARAQMVDAAGRFEDAVAAVNLALRAAPRWPELYARVALLLGTHRHFSEAVDLLDRAERFVPVNPNIWLTKVILLEISGRNQAAEALLEQAKVRWPESPDAHMLSGILLATRKQSAQAIDELNAALALGAQNPAIYYYLAEARLQTDPGEPAEAAAAVAEAVRLDPADPWTRVLAGKIALAQHHLDRALGELQEAVRLRPQTVSAHYTLARVYSALGRKTEEQAEWDRVRQYRAQYPHESEDPDLIHSDSFRFTP